MISQDKIDSEMMVAIDKVKADVVAKVGKVTTEVLLDIVCSQIVEVHSALATLQDRIEAIHNLVCPECNGKPGRGLH